MEVVSFIQHGHLWSFAVLVIGIIALPGADMAFVMGNTLAGGRLLGIAAISGIVAGGIAHSVMAYFGIGLVLQAVPWAYSLMLFVGAIYLAWIGVQLFLSAPASDAATSVTIRSQRETVVQGMMTSLLNPKAYFFMLAIYPQFIRPQEGSLGMQIIILGTIIATVQIAIYGGTAWSMVKVIKSSTNSQTLQIRLSRTFGVLLIGFAVLSVTRAFSGN
ncbi:MAG: LysE family translocator [Lysobacterales bacterium]